MKLSRIEFLAMNNPFRRFIQRHIEFRNFRGMGLSVTDKDLLEVGCGSGYGAQLLSELRPASYVGVDLMPEQIALASKRNLKEFKFLVMDAADMNPFDDSLFDEVVVFGILHHIPEWRRVLAECHRLMRPGGSVFVEEPDGNYLRKFDSIMHWGHPVSARFTLDEFENGLSEAGFSISAKKRMLGFGIYRADKPLSKN